MLLPVPRSFAVVSHRMFLPLLSPPVFVVTLVCCFRVLSFLTLFHFFGFVSKLRYLAHLCALSPFSSQVAMEDLSDMMANSFHHTSKENSDMDVGGGGLREEGVERITFDLVGRVVSEKNFLVIRCNPILNCCSGQSRAFNSSRWGTIASYYNLITPWIEHMQWREALGC